MNENEVLELEAQELPKTELAAENESSDSGDELSRLRAELEELRNELRAREESERAQSRFISELAEFEQYFPEVDVRSVPDEIWERVKSGAPLAPSYALFLRSRELQKKRVGDFNEKNRRMSAGSLMRSEGENYFSPSEVRRMSPAQVKANYDDIVQSMKHWN